MLCVGVGGEVTRSKFKVGGRSIHVFMLMKGK